jgi:hypothetical protein
MRRLRTRRRPGGVSSNASPASFTVVGVAGRSRPWRRAITASCRQASASALLGVQWERIFRPLASFT